MGYPRMELEPGFFLERYLGWTLLARGERFKLLSRRVGPLRRLVLLSDGAPLHDIEHLARSHRIFRPLTTLLWNDFSGGGEQTLLGRDLAEVRDGKWFGAGTFVFDLSESEDTLFGRIATRERSKIRKAERTLEIEIGDGPSGKVIDDFTRLYGLMARQRGLDPLDRTLLDRMLADGVITFARAHQDGRTLTVNVLYRTERHAYYFHAAQEPEVKETGGHLLLWRSLQHLKGRGIRWYDFGLVPSTDPENGIYRFKKCFGGAFEPSGTQRERASRWIGAAANTLRRGRAAWNKAAMKVGNA